MQTNKYNNIKKKKKKKSISEQKKKRNQLNYTSQYVTQMNKGIN